MDAAASLVAKDRFMVPLSGIAIGNGKMDALTQDPEVIDYAYWHGLIDGPSRDYFHAEWHHCVQNLQAGHTTAEDEPEPFHPFSVRDDYGVFGAILDAAGAGALDDPLSGGPNIYECSTWDPYAAAMGADGTVSKFYNNPAVQKALNVPKRRQGPNHVRQGCIAESEEMDLRRRHLKTRQNKSNGRRNTNNSHNNHSDVVSSMASHRRKLFMDFDTPWSAMPYVAQLLDEAKIGVLIYSGDRDIICCTQGSEEALRKMEWSGTRESAPVDGQLQGMVSPYRNAWTESPRGLWLYNDYPAGYTKSYKNLNFLTIYNSGHMGKNL